MMHKVRGANNENFMFQNQNLKYRRIGHRDHNQGYFLLFYLRLQVYTMNAHGCNFQGPGKSVKPNFGCLLFMPTRHYKIY